MINITNQMPAAGELTAIYNAALPSYQMDEERFADKYAVEDCTGLCAYDGEGENSRPVGFALSCKAELVLLCVLPEYQRRGVGSALLAQAEAQIKVAGFDKIKIGGWRSALQGAPELYGGKEFFAKNNYEPDWLTVNMAMDLADFDVDKLNLPPVESNIIFRMAEESDKDALLLAVKENTDFWYDIYIDTPMREVLLALCNGEILGYLQINPGERHFVKPGAQIGCVGVTKNARRRGVGRRLVAEGMQKLKLSGEQSVELLYIELVDWYRRLGLEVTDRQYIIKDKSLIVD
jgi:ribosomal protein S18 acetylase RimI-like enzyme